MTQSEQLAAALATFGAGIPLLLLAWRTIVFPHDSPYWPLLVPLALLLLLVATTVLTRRTISRFWAGLQSAIYFSALASALVTAVGICILAFRAFNAPHLEEPGLLLLLFIAAFVPTCLYACAVLCIDQRKLRGRLVAIWKALAVAATLPVLLLGAWAFVEIIGG